MVLEGRECAVLNIERVFCICLSSIKALCQDKPLVCQVCCGRASNQRPDECMD